MTIIDIGHVPVTLIGTPTFLTLSGQELTRVAIVNADISASAAIDYSKLASLTDGNILVGNGSNVATSVNPSGDVDISNAGVFSIASGVIINADVNASAAIDYSKLAALTDGNILVGNGSNVATSVNPSGDVDVSNAGVFSISAGAIVDADVSATAEISVSKLANGTARQLPQTDAGGTDVEWTSNIDIPGTLDVTGVATLDSNALAGGYLRVGSTSAPANTTAGDLTVIRLSVGNTVFSDANGTAANVMATTTKTAAGATSMIAAINTISPASNSSSEFRLLNFSARPSASAGITVSEVRNIVTEVRVRQSGTITTTEGINSWPVLADSGSPGTISVTNATGFIASMWRTSGSTAITVGTYIGYQSKGFVAAYSATATTITHFQANNSGANTITNQYGLYIENLTSATNDYGIYIAGADTYAIWVDSGHIRLDSAFALGGGTAPTLGTIGGSGPATAAQNEWIKIETQNGVRFIPAWA